MLATRTADGTLLPLLVCHGDVMVTKPHLGGLIRQKLVQCPLFTFVHEPIDGSWDGDVLTFPELPPIDAFCAIQLAVEQVNPTIAWALWQHKKLLNTIGDEKTHIPTIQGLPVVSFEAACDSDLVLLEIGPED